ncbi:EAL domain-containing protein [Dyella ginsengisoli]|uniref:EAL domain-containing protein n=1 Tax=Dyella ginsengisoli TaxID=363848 RepID=UPI0004755056|nr:EAL domain-containing protein [Dyella ginsengisoli]
MKNGDGKATVRSARDGSRAVQLARNDVLLRISAIAWSADCYLDFIQRVADTLLTLDEIVGCAIGRPDAYGRFHFKAVAGSEAFMGCLRAVERGEHPDIRAEAQRIGGSMAMGRAWQSGGIQRTFNYATDPEMTVWRGVALGLGIRSNAAIPVRLPKGTTESVLTLYSSATGGFSTASQHMFLLHLQSLLGLALTRLLPKTEGIEAAPLLLRDHWRAKLATDDLVMHYQPVIDLRLGKVVEVEALARIRDDDHLILPAWFLPALGSDDLLFLYQQGLTQALAAHQQWATDGLALGIAVNLPSSALLDRRYVDITREALERYPCPSGTLVLELLESEWMEESIDAESGLLALKALGVQLAEDDLGSAYSSLSRLRHLSFDRIKIDQTLVAQVARQPLRTLYFIYQLTRLGHDLGVKVVVEGLETAGLIEAATILGADLGQGIALARPMSGAHVADWCVSSRFTCDPMAPRTALGALSVFLLWEDRLRMFMDDTAMIETLVRTPCRVDAYLHASAAKGTRLDRIHRLLHRVAIRQGPASASYTKARNAFIECLIEDWIRIEENG